MRILEVAVSLDCGGIDNYLLNYCTRIEGIDFDYAIFDLGKKGALEETFIKRGSTVFHVPCMSKGIKKYINAMTKIMTEKKYDLVHVHLGYKSVFALIAAKKCGIKVRIVHSHLANEPLSFKEKLIKLIVTPFTKHLATNLVACGKDAGKWMWKKNFVVFNNAIETHKFSYNSVAREKIRKDLGIQDSFVVGNVGRLSDQKNPEKILSIFAQVLSIKKNAMLIFVGGGELEEAILQRARELHISNNVMSLGIRHDVPDLLSSMDVFLFPSKYEGLPFALIESQCNGLPSVCSDVITTEVRVCHELIHYVSLNQSDLYWANKVIDLSNASHISNADSIVANSGYDINVESKKMKHFYIESVKKH